MASSSSCSAFDRKSLVSVALLTHEEDERRQHAVYARLHTLFRKNKFGYHTQITNDFDLLLEAMLNEKFVDASTLYYDDPNTQKEIEDVESGLNGDMTESDIANLLKDRKGHPAREKCFRYLARFGTNYDRTDDLSVYRVVPNQGKSDV